MTKEKILYEELTPAEFRARLGAAPIAYLPMGTLEWHGSHLPLGSDGIQSRGFLVELAHQVGGIVLPMLFLGPDRAETHNGYDYYGMDINSYPQGKPEQGPGSAYWVDNELFRRMLNACLTQLKRAGFRIIVAHGHGPSVELFAENISDWEERLGLHLFTCWRDDEFRLSRYSDGFGLQTDHAAANETSLVMALRPDLVDMAALPSDLEEWPIGVDGLDPRKHASAEQGRRIIHLQLERMKRLLTGALSGNRGE